MNRTEQKERVVEIIERFDVVIAEFKALEPEYDTHVKAFEKFHSNLSLDGYGDILEIDLEQFSHELAKSMLSNQTEFDSLVELITDFESELEEYMDEISESRREKLEERYMDLEDISSELSSDFDGEESFNDIVERLTEHMRLFKCMK